MTAVALDASPLNILRTMRGKIVDARIAYPEVLCVEVEDSEGELRCKLSDGSLLDVKPAAREAEDDPPNWELITPAPPIPGPRGAAARPAPPRCRP
jgi:hypothetical protein